MGYLVSTIPPAIFLLYYGTLCRAQEEPDDNDTPVPENFPKAFVVAMAVGIVSVVLLLTLVCVLAHCWQYILGRVGVGGAHGLVTSSGVPERWLDPVFEWPQQLHQQFLLRPRSRNSYHQHQHQHQHHHHYRRSKKNRRRLRDRIKLRMVESGWGGGGDGGGGGVKGVGLRRTSERADLVVGGGGYSRNMGW
ncbi:hypothetical protein F4774DRAFT_231163 [Daldinia eschscholtzii]|nr:hypothetical protein F4774DRAFT_231163 [Daldinia eschscholtzii]